MIYLIFLSGVAIGYVAGVFAAIAWAAGAFDSVTRKEK